MPVAEGACPSCGAPMTFGVGASTSKICPFCKAIVVRGDRGLENLGQVAAIAPTPSLVAIGDEAEIDGRKIRVLGRVQLDHGEGPWDEWYVHFEDDDSWAWLAYAQGNWYVTRERACPPLGPFDALALGATLLIDDERFLIVEKKQGRVLSGEGELPEPIVPGAARFYADVSGAGFRFGTFDWGEDRGGKPRFSLGAQIAEGRLRVTRPAAERPKTEIGAENIVCPQCGAPVKTLAPNRAEHLACPYCNAVSDIAARRVVEQQDAARMALEIPLGSSGALDGQPYVVCGYVERAARIEGEAFSWQEYLLFGAGLGFRWLVKDEGKWLFVEPLCAAEVHTESMPQAVGYDGDRYLLRNHNDARVSYVLGEFYWRVRVNERVECHDFVRGGVVVSRESPGDEILWSLSRPIDDATIRAAFGLPEPTFSRTSLATSSFARPRTILGMPPQTFFLTLIVIVLFLIVASIGDCDDGDGGFFLGGFRGGK